MQAAAGGALQAPATGFLHGALFYSGLDDFLDRTVPFLLDGVRDQAPTLVVVSEEKIAGLQSRLGAAADEIQFADMAEVGSNPARILPVWWDFIAEHGTVGAPARGIGEPIWSGRRPSELVESQRHEVLLNPAFGDGPPWWLLCPYDMDSLAPQVIAEARRSHPVLLADDRLTPSADYHGEYESEVLQGPLPPPPDWAQWRRFTAGSLSTLRGFIQVQADWAGHGTRADDLVLAVNEVATNSLLHGGGGGSVHIWTEGDDLICEIVGKGQVADPFAGRRRPPAERVSGRGLWLANQVCDLVQIRAEAGQTTVRLHLWRSS